MADEHISEYQFQNLEQQVSASEGTEDFRFESFNELSKKKHNLTSTQIRSEREHATQGNFQIDAIVKDYRGVSEQEEEDFQNKVKYEVEQKLKTEKDKALEEGLLQGKESGEKKAYGEVSGLINEQVDQLQELTSLLKKQMDGVLEEHQQALVQFSKAMLKWLVGKEIQEENYIDRLFFRMIQEVNNHNNLIIRVDVNSMNKIDLLRKVLEEKIGSIDHVRFQVDQNITGQGIIIENDNGLIYGTKDALYESIEKAFEEGLRE